MDHLSTSEKFITTSETDYTVLASRISILDITLGPGLTSIPYFPPDTELPVVQTPEERTFNQMIDQLAGRVQFINNEIVAAGGMSDLARCEAKEAADRLYYRLESAVRTRGRKRRAVFGDEREEEEEERKGFARFFKKKDDAAVVNGGAEVIGVAK